MKKFQIEINGEMIDLLYYLYENYFFNFYKTYFRSYTTRVKPGNKMNVDSTFKTNNCGISTLLLYPFWLRYK